jgi:hypothetical protein
MMNWWLDPIPEPLRDGAVAAAESGDMIGFLITASNECGLELVFWNTERLQRLGVYERALLDAFSSTRTNNSGFGLGNLRRMFERADRSRLREAGDALPASGPFMLYRGVAGRGRARYARGLSWTASLADAKWFAVRYAVDFPSPFAFLENPAVYRTIVDADDVLACVNDRKEQEFIVLLPKSNHPKLLLDAAALRAAADEIAAWNKMKRSEAEKRAKESAELYQREHAEEIAAMRAKRFDGNGR